MSERSISSSGGSSPSLPSHGSTLFIFGNEAPFTAAVVPRPKDKSLKLDHHIRRFNDDMQNTRIMINWKKKVNLRNSEIPSSENEPFNMEYFIFL